MPVIRIGADGERLGRIKLDSVYIGIDPGMSGGIATICGDCVRTWKMPATLRDLWELLSDMAEGQWFALLEQVGGYHKGSESATTKSGEQAGGGGAANGSAMFKFGQNTGACEMALIAAGIPYEVWHPAKWQKLVNVPPKKPGETRTARKNRLKQQAQRLFPRETVTLATCDALLIAEACRRFRVGEKVST